MTVTKQLSEHERKNFENMIAACGRNPADYSLAIADGSGNIIISNKVSGKQKEYTRDHQVGWILEFATNLKLGVI